MGQCDGARLAMGSTKEENGMSDDEAHATMTLGALPTERQKALGRLMYASLAHGIAALKMGAAGIAAGLDVDDLSFRRNGGKIDVTEAVFGGPALEGAMDLLMEAALGFAEADAAHKAAKVGSEGP